jgi:hypothetical protein
MKFEVKGQRLELVGSNVVAEGAVEFTTFTLECDESWDGYERVVRFRHTSHESVWDVAGVRDGEVYYVPSEVLVRGSVFVSVVGVKNGISVATTETSGFFDEGAVDSGKTPTVTPDAYAQYVMQASAVQSGVEAALALTLEAEEDCSDAKKVCEVCAAECSELADACRESERTALGVEKSVNEALETVRDAAESLV